MRRHHYVPKSLQKYFTDNGKNIWFSQIACDGKYSGPELRNLVSTFQRHDFYTVIDDNGVPSDSVEREIYGPLDDYLGDLLSEVHGRMDLGETPVFEGEVLESLLDLFIALATRGPLRLTGQDYNDYEQGLTFANQLIEKLVGLDKYHPDIAFYQDTLNNRRKLIDRGRDIRVRATTKGLPKTKNELGNFQARVAVSTGGHSFVLHGRMIYRIGNGGSNGLLCPRCELWLPISSKRALVLLRDPTNRIPFVCQVGREQMREFNSYAVSLGSDLASHSIKLLQSLIPASKRHGIW